MNRQSVQPVAYWPCETQALSVAYSVVPLEYLGPCRLITGAKESPGFPCYSQALKAARTAINLMVGGFGEVEIQPCEVGDITHLTVDDWI